MHILSLQIINLIATSFVLPLASDICPDSMTIGQIFNILTFIFIEIVVIAACLTKVPRITSNICMKTKKNVAITELMKQHNITWRK